MVIFFNIHKKDQLQFKYFLLYQRRYKIFNYTYLNTITFRISHLFILTACFQCFHTDNYMSEKS